MKFKSITLSIFTAFCSLNAFAECVGPTVNGRCLGTQINNYGNSTAQEDSGYRGTSGAQYQYDLGNPLDQNRYTTDRDAQRRDQMNSDPRQQQDRQQNQ